MAIDSGGGGGGNDTWRSVAEMTIDNGDGGGGGNDRWPSGALGQGRSVAVAGAARSWSDGTIYLEKIRRSSIRSFDIRS